MQPIVSAEHNFSGQLYLEMDFGQEYLGRYNRPRSFSKSSGHRLRVETRNFAGFVDRRAGVLWHGEFAPPRGFIHSIFVGSVTNESINLRLIESINEFYQPSHTWKVAKNSTQNKTRTTEYLQISFSKLVVSEKRRSACNSSSFSTMALAERTISLVKRNQIFVLAFICMFPYA
jgi:hypothetical protein